MTDLVHSLDTDILPPRQFTYPFCYEPHPLCIAAAKEVQRYIEGSGVWAEEKGPGKMFGVLCVRVRVSEKGKGKSEKGKGKSEKSISIIHSSLFPNLTHSSLNHIYNMKHRNSSSLNHII